MQNGFKINIVFKSLIILILGYLIFEFGFNLITGYNPLGNNASVTSGHHGNSGNSYELIISGLLFLLIKLLIILLFIFLISFTLKFVKGKLSMLQSRVLKLSKKSNNEAKILIVLFVSVISIIIIVSIFNGFIVGSRVSNNIFDVNTTKSITLNSYGILSAILNIVVYSVAIILGFELYFYLEKLINEIDSFPLNVEKNNLDNKTSNHLIKKRSID